MTLANLPVPNFTGADLSARVNAAVTELRAGRTLPTVAALLADATLAYGTGFHSVAPGDIVRAAAGGHAYTVAASTATDPHLTTAGGVKLMVQQGPRGWDVRAFGARGDGATDDTAAFVAARAAATASGGGTLYASKGVYVLHEFALTNGTNEAQGTLALVGDYGATVIRARDAGRFAVTLHQAAFSQPWWAVSIRDVLFSGRVGGVKRMGCGLYAPREHRLENVGFHECLIGLCTGDNYYFGGRNLNFRDCDVGCLNGTFGTGATAIADLVNGAGATVGVTLPFAMANPLGHAGNKHWDTIRINTCRIGWAGVGATSYNPHNLFTKASIETCDLGMLMIRGGGRLVEPWFEGNGTSGTVTLNGTAYEKGALVAGSTSASGDIFESFGGQVLVQGGRLGRLVARAGGSVEVDGGTQLFEADVLEAVGGRVLMDRAQADNRSFSCLIRRPFPIHSTGRAIVCLSEARIDPTLRLQPRGGKVLVAEPFTGTALLSAKVTTTAALAFGQAGGLMPEQKFATVTAADFGLNLGIGADLVAGEYYAIALTLRSSQALTLTAVNVAGFVAPLPNQVQHPLGDWFTLGLVTRSQAAAGTPRLRLQAGAAATLDLGGLQVARFANRLDAAEFMAERRFFLTEG